MNRPSNERLAGAVCLCSIAAVLAVAFAFPGNPALATTLGIFGGVLGGLLLSITLYVSQAPSFSVRAANDEYNPKLGGMYFLHVIVRNNARGFLGGGTASDCEGVLVVNHQRFTPKWASRPEPLSWHLVPVDGDKLRAVPWIDWALMEECKSETLGPREERTLDIAVKVAGDRNVYIHEPRNYEDPQHKRNPLPPGSYSLSLTLKYRGGQSGAISVTLVNDDSELANSAKVLVP